MRPTYRRATALVRGSHLVSGRRPARQNCDLVSRILRALAHGLGRLPLRDLAPALLCPTPNCVPLRVAVPRGWLGPEVERVEAGQAIDAASVVVAPPGARSKVRQLVTHRRHTISHDRWPNTTMVWHCYASRERCKQQHTADSNHSFRCSAPCQHASDSAENPDVSRVISYVGPVTRGQRINRGRGWRRIGL